MVSCSYVLTLVSGIPSPADDTVSCLRGRAYWTSRANLKMAALGTYRDATHLHFLSACYRDASLWRCLGELPQEALLAHRRHDHLHDPAAHTSLVPSPSTFRADLIFANQGSRQRAKNSPARQGLGVVYLSFPALPRVVPVGSSFIDSARGLL